jgi:PH (Pleckstrin Homology) domain-containing protein
VIFHTGRRWREAHGGERGVRLVRVEIRDAFQPDDEAAQYEIDTDFPDDGGDGDLDAVNVPAQPRQWRVERRFTIAKIAIVVISLVVALIYLGDSGRVVIATAIALAFAVLAARDLVAPVRVAADFQGVTVVTGYAGRRRLTWDEIEAVRLDSRMRFGRRAETLEIDAGDWLFLYGASELGEPCRVALARLHALQAAASTT